MSSQTPESKTYPDFLLLPENPADFLTAAIREHAVPLAELFAALGDLLHPTPNEIEMELEEVKEERDAAVERNGEYDDIIRAVNFDLTETSAALDGAFIALGEGNAPVDRAAVRAALEVVGNRLDEAICSLRSI